MQIEEFANTLTLQGLDSKEGFKVPKARNVRVWGNAPGKPNEVLKR
jgi:hypothetical protein